MSVVERIKLAAAAVGDLVVGQEHNRPNLLGDTDERIQYLDYLYNWVLKNKRQTRPQVILDIPLTVFMKMIKDAKINLVDPDNIILYRAGKSVLVIEKDKECRSCPHVDSCEQVRTITTYLADVDHPTTNPNFVFVPWNAQNDEDGKIFRFCMGENKSEVFYLTDKDEEEVEILTEVRSILHSLAFELA